MIKKIHHVGIVVRNVEQAFAFYRDALGLPVGKMDTIPDQGVKAALLPVGHSEIELLEPIRDDTGVARFLATRGEGMHHICFESDDVDRELEELKAKDAQLIDQQSRPGLAGMVAFMHPRCTHKTLVELATPPSGAAAIENTVSAYRPSSRLILTNLPPFICARPLLVPIHSWPCLLKCSIETWLPGKPSCVV